MKTPRHFPLIRATALAAVFFLGASVRAIDPPHLTTSYCGSCHLAHFNLGTDLTTIAGNANLCMSCHTPGGSASVGAFVSADQSLPWPGLPTGTNAAGTSHRWDANAAGHLVYLGGAVTPSTGTIFSSGVYTGAYAKTYTLTIATSGTVGTARFNWSATTPGGGAGANVLTGTNVPLDSGVFTTFVNGTNGLFQTGDRWNLFVRNDLRNPTNAALLLHMTNGVLRCSTCHDQHSESVQPFDPTAQAYVTNSSGTLLSGTNRHFMRITNNFNQLCNDCHAARKVINAVAGSHPVEIGISVNATNKLPTLLPLEAGTNNFGCLTCHVVHHGPDGDGKLLRLASSVALCSDCHTDSDTNSAHFSTTNGATLWPGTNFTSLMPARTDPNDRGTCLNCHATHGWPTNAANPTIHFDHLLPDFQENFCYACHATNGPAAKKVYADFQQAYRHPVVNSDPLRRTGRSVECDDCHNPHKAKSGSHVYTATATQFRNTVTNAPSLIGMDGVTFNYSGLTNFQAVATNLFTYIPKTTGVTNEYQICFKCHSGYSWGTGTPPNGNSPNGSASSPVETDVAQEFSPMNKSGHPIVIGLNNYPNSIAPKALATGALKAPWNMNVGTQTMMCSDCHDATTTNYVASAAQGPHGSANQFILRGPNAANWPNVTTFASSWCANCHIDNVAINSSTLGGGTHTSHHGPNACYRCHVVIPHGGKMSRLMADRDGVMPARYAYNNDKTTIYMVSFTKDSATTYNTESQCRTSCGDHSSSSSSSMENW